MSRIVAGTDNSSMASLDEESTLLRGNAAPKYRTNLIVGALAAASFMFGVGVATTLDRNAARATRLDIADQASIVVDQAGDVVDQAGSYINDPSTIPVEKVVDTVQPIVEKVSVVARRSRRPRFRFSAIRGKTKAFESFRAQGRKVVASPAASRAAIRSPAMMSILSILLKRHHRSPHRPEN